MMKCASCEESIPVDSECVSCSVCSAKYHFSCITIRETKWRNMTPEQKNKWACMKCKSESNTVKVNNSSSSSSSSANVSGTGGDNLADGEDGQSIKALLLQMNTRLNTLDQVKATVDGMSESLQFLSNKYDDLIKEVKTYKEENKKLSYEVGKLQTECKQKDVEINELTKRFNAYEQYGRGINLEIHGIEQVDYETSEGILEKTAKALEVSYHPSMVQAAHRIPTRDRNKPPMFLVQFCSKAVKQLWLQQGRKRKLRSRDIVGLGEGRVYFNENLTPFFSKLFRETKSVARSKGYESVWLLNGTIRVKKNYTSRQTFIIGGYEDLNKLV